jgi:6-phosphogluconolactonase (cycloisomerase 2 family)
MSRTRYRRPRCPRAGRAAVFAGTAAIALGLFAPPASALAATGALTPLGCVASPTNNPAACGQTAAGLNWAYGVTVSHDGRSVYALGWDDNAVVSFKRNPTTGTLTKRGCIADVTANPASCISTTKGLLNPAAIAVSRDGLSVYVAAESPGMLVRFARDTKTGALTPRGCIGERGDNPSGCLTTVKGLSDPNAIALSNDGRSVYVAAYNSEAIVTFGRNTTTGRLTSMGCIGERGQNVDGCSSTIVGGLNEPYLGSVSVSSDGRFVYAAGSAGSSIAMFRRDVATGRLTPRGCVADPANNPEGCSRTARGLKNPYGIALSRNGTSAYAADYGTSGVVRFKRDPKTGVLKSVGCIADPLHNNAGCTRTATGLFATQWVAVSNDGRSVYAVGAVSNAIVRFARDRTTGALGKTGCLADSAHDPAGCATTTPGLWGVHSLALSDDGASLYAPAPADNAVALFRRTT